MANETNTSVITAIIAGVMRDETQNLNRSSALIAFMFKNEASYAKEVIASIFRQKGSDRTDVIDNQLIEASPEFKGAKVQLAALTAIKAADRTEADKNAMESINKTMRAARIMYTRALAAVYGLRHHNALDVTASKRKTGSLTVEYLKSQEGNKTKTTDKEETCSRLISAGEKALAEVVGIASKKAKTTARNPAATSLADSSKALAATLTGVANSKDAGKFDLLTNNSELDNNMRAIHKALIAIECSDEKGLMDTAAVGKLLSEVTGRSLIVQVAKPLAKKAA
jgi:hypothetical protein